jgi:hypothetical protein
MASLPRLTIVVALAILAASARPAAAQQQLPRADSPRAGVRYSWLDALRRRLLVGSDSGKQAAGVTRLQLPELPPVAYRLAETQRRRGLPLRDSVTTQCPMPVFRTRSGSSDSMPVIKADSTRLEKMPVVRAGCVNPLNRK